MSRSIVLNGSWLVVLALMSTGCGRSGAVADESSSAAPKQRSCCPSCVGAMPMAEAATPVADEPAADTDAPAADKKEPAGEKADDARYKAKGLFDGKTLGGWKKTSFGGEGAVEVKDGMIVLEQGNDMTGITLAGETLKDNYELTLEAQRLGGSDFFASTTFPVGKEHCTLVVGGWGGTIVGLSCVDGYDASDNPTTKFLTFKDNQWYRIRIRVSEPLIEAWIDDELVVDLARGEHKFSTRFECDPCKPLGVATWQTKGAVRGLKIRELTPDELKDINDMKR